MNQTLEELKKDYKDFYWEQGKYKNRKLGFDECWAWIDEALNQRTNEVIEGMLVEEMSVRNEKDGADNDWNKRAFYFNQCCALQREKAKRITNK